MSKHKILSFDGHSHILCRLIIIYVLDSELGCLDQVGETDYVNGCNDDGFHEDCEDYSVIDRIIQRVERFKKGKRLHYNFNYLSTILRNKQLRH